MAAFKERIEKLKENKEQQQFIEGVVFTLDGLFRYGSLKDLVTPFKREQFISCALANTYSTAYHMELDPETHMRGLVESKGKYEAESFIIAMAMNEILGAPVNISEKMRVEEMLFLASIKEV